MTEPDKPSDQILNVLGLHVVTIRQVDEGVLMPGGVRLVLDVEHPETKFVWRLETVFTYEQRLELEQLLRLMGEAGQ